MSVAVPRLRAVAPPSAAALLLGSAILYLLYRIHDVLIPFALSFSLAYLVNPIINHFQARGLRRDHMVLTLYLAIAGAITCAANWIFPATINELSLLQSKVPIYLKQSQQILHTLQSEAARRLPFAEPLIDHWNLKLYEPLTEQLPKLPSYLLGLFPLFSLIFVVPFITFFLLSDSDKMLRRVIQLCPSRYVEQALHLLSEVDTSLGNYIRGVLIIVLAIGLSSYVGLRLLGVEYALAVATLAGASSLIPYLGAVLGAVVGGLVAFAQFRRATVPLQVLLLFLGIRLADEALIQPLVAKHTVKLHPLFFLLALMVGGKLFGFVGLLFAVPAACVLKALLKVAWDWYASEAQIASDIPPYDPTTPYC